MALNYHRAIQVRNGVSEGIDDAVVIEDRFRIFFNDYPVADMVASRNQLRELGAGFVITEGITRCVDKAGLMGTAFLCTLIPGVMHVLKKGGRIIGQESVSSVNPCPSHPISVHMPGFPW